MESEYTYYTSIEVTNETTEVVLRVSGFRDMEDAEDIAEMIHNILAEEKIMVH